MSDEANAVGEQWTAELTDRPGVIARGETIEQACANALAGDCNDPSDGLIRFLMAEAEKSEKHFTPEALGELWSLSTDTVRRVFEKEPGVLVIERSRPHARRYRTMRIPESVAERVHRRLRNPD